jgi:hypothetical protein
MSPFIFEVLETIVIELLFGGMKGGVCANTEAIIIESIPIYVYREHSNILYIINVTQG